MLSADDILLKFLSYSFKCDFRHKRYYIELM